MVELMLTIAVFAVLAGVGVPSLSEFLRNSRSQSMAYEFMNSINSARSEALKTGREVQVCRSANPDAATPACGGGTQDWSTGWIAYINGDGADGFSAAGDTLLFAHAGVGFDLEMRTNAAADAFVTFANSGALETPTVLRFALCDVRGADRGRQIDIGPIGRPSLTKGTDASPLATCTP